MWYNVNTKNTGCITLLWPSDVCNLPFTFKMWPCLLRGIFVPPPQKKAFVVTSPVSSQKLYFADPYDELSPHFTNNNCAYAGVSSVSWQKQCYHQRLRKSPPLLTRHGSVFAAPQKGPMKTVPPTTHHEFYDHNSY